MMFLEWALLTVFLAMGIWYHYQLETLFFMILTFFYHPFFYQGLPLKVFLKPTSDAGLFLISLLVLIGYTGVREGLVYGFWGGDFSSLNPFFSIPIQKSSFVPPHGFLFLITLFLGTWWAFPWGEGQLEKRKPFFDFNHFSLCSKPWSKMSSFWVFLIPGLIFCLWYGLRGRVHLNAKGLSLRYKNELLVLNAWALGYFQALKKGNMVGSFFDQREKKIILWLGFVLFVTGWSFFLDGKTMGIAFIVSAGVYGLLEGGILKKRVYAFLMCISLSLQVPFIVIMDRFFSSSLEGVMGFSRSVFERLVVWRRCLSWAALSPWWGIGSSTLYQALKKTIWAFHQGAAYKSVTFHPHLLTLEVYASWGMVGLILTLVTFILGTRVIIQKDDSSFYLALMTYFCILGSFYISFKDLWILSACFIVGRWQWIMHSSKP